MEKLLSLLQNIPLLPFQKEEYSCVDINYIALSGLLSLTGKNDGDPVIPGTQIADIAGGSLMAAISILAALFFREKTGHGQYIDISMMDGAFSLNPLAFDDFYSTEKTPRPRLLGSMPYYNIYKTKDNKHISIGAIEPKFWVNLCNKLSREDLITKQYDESGETLGELKNIFISKTRREWDNLLSQEDVCYSPILNVKEAVRNQQVIDRLMVLGVKGYEGNALKQVGIAPKFSLTPGVIKTPPPTPGQHTCDILCSLGISEREISRLEKEKVIGCS